MRASWDRHVGFVGRERRLPNAIQIPLVVSSAERVVVGTVERNRCRPIDYNLAGGGTRRPAQGDQTYAWTN